VRDPIDDLGIWKFPDVSTFTRKWVDDMIDFGMNKWPRGKDGQNEKKDDENEKKDAGNQNEKK
jgi:hypothetical protein